MEVKNIGEEKRSSNGLLVPNQDVVFQALFGTKGSEKILGGFLSNILGKKVDNISLEANQNLVRETVDEKLGIVDLRANVGDDTTVHIEVQMSDPYNMFKRLLWYWSRIYGVQLKNSEDYGILKKTISILIVNYDIKELEWFKDAHTVWNLSEDRNITIKPFKNLEIHIIELPKIKKYQHETEKGLNAWLEFLSNPESEEVKMSKEKDKDLNDAYEKLEYISDDAELRWLADRRLMAILDENSKRRGDRKIKEEIEKGRKELEEGQKELEEGQKELEEGRKELEEGQKELEEGQKELEEGQKELEEGQKELEEGQKELEEGRKKLNKKKQEIHEKGKDEARIEIAKKLLERNIEIHEITKITGLSEKEIKLIN